MFFLGNEYSEHRRISCSKSLRAIYGSEEVLPSQPLIMSKHPRNASGPGEQRTGDALPLGSGEPGVLAVAINTPPTRGTVRVRSTPPGLDDRPATASAKRRGVAFADGDPKIREVYEYLVESINRVENQLNLRIDEMALSSAKRADELVTSCAKRTEVVDRFSEVQQTIDQLRGGARSDLEERLAQADKNASDILQKHEEALQKLAAQEDVIKKVTESSFTAMHDAVQSEVNILKDKCGALSVEIEQSRLEVNLTNEQNSLNLNQAVAQLTLDIAEARSGHTRTASEDLRSQNRPLGQASVNSGSAGARVGGQGLVVCKCAGSFDESGCHCKHVTELQKRVRDIPNLEALNAMQGRLNALSHDVMEVNRRVRAMPDPISGAWPRNGAQGGPAGGEGGFSGGQGGGFPGGHGGFGGRGNFQQPQHDGMPRAQVGPNRVTWQTKIFEDKMALDDLYRYNGVKGGDEWRSRIRGYFIGCCPSLKPAALGGEPRRHQFQPR